MDRIRRKKCWISPHCSVWYTRINSSNVNWKESKQTKPTVCVYLHTQRENAKRKLNNKTQQERTTEQKEKKHEQRKNERTPSFTHAFFPIWIFHVVRLIFAHIQTRFPVYATISHRYTRALPRFQHIPHTSFKRALFPVSLIQNHTTIFASVCSIAQHFFQAMCFCSFFFTSFHLAYFCLCNEILWNWLSYLAFHLKMH